MKILIGWKTKTSIRGGKKELQEIITSPQNSTIKFIKSLHRKKYREQHGKYFVEGIKMVREGLKHKIPLEMLVYSADFNLDDLEAKENLQDIATLAVEPSLFKQISDVQSPQGIIGIAQKQEMTMDKWMSSNTGLWVILDRVQDPGNVGTIIRTLDAVRGAGVALLTGCADPYNPKTLRSTMGAIFRVPILEIQDDGVFLEQLSRLRPELIVSCLEGSHLFEWCPNPNSRQALVIGNESRGVREEIYKYASSLVTIPICGGAESLNASVAAGILIYEILRKTGNFGQGDC